jgi:hypothetical protein
MRFLITPPSPFGWHFKSDSPHLCLPPPFSSASTFASQRDSFNLLLEYNHKLELAAGRYHDFHYRRHRYARQRPPRLRRKQRPHTFDPSRLRKRRKGPCAQVLSWRSPYMVAWSIIWKVIYFCTHGRCSQIFWQTQYAKTYWSTWAWESGTGMLDTIVEYCAHARWFISFDPRCLFRTTICIERLDSEFPLQSLGSSWYNCGSGTLNHPHVSGTSKC